MFRTLLKKQILLETMIAVNYLMKSIILMKGQTVTIFPLQTLRLIVQVLKNNKKTSSFFGKKKNTNDYYQNLCKIKSA